MLLGRCSVCVCVCTYNFVSYIINYFISCIIYGCLSSIQFSVLAHFVLIILPVILLTPNILNLQGLFDRTNFMFFKLELLWCLQFSKQLKVIYFLCTRILLIYITSSGTRYYRDWCVLYVYVLHDNPPAPSYSIHTRHSRFIKRNIFINKS